MGVYLSEPNKEKHITAGSGKGLTFVSAEMQGNPPPTKAGGKTWRMQTYIMLISAMATHSSPSSMATAVHTLTYSGFEVSKYVAEIFVKTLTALPAYKVAKYKEALDESFKLVD
jgi:hypothetical protein